MDAQQPISPRRPGETRGQLLVRSSEPAPLEPDKRRQSLEPKKSPLPRAPGRQARRRHLLGGVPSFGPGGCWPTGARGQRATLALPDASSGSSQGHGPFLEYRARVRRAGASSAGARQHATILSEDIATAAIRGEYGAETSSCAGTPAAGSGSRCASESRPVNLGRQDRETRSCGPICHSSRRDQGAEAARLCRVSGCPSCLWCAGSIPAGGAADRAMFRRPAVQSACPRRCARASHARPLVPRALRGRRLAGPAVKGDCAPATTTQNNQAQTSRACMWSRITTDEPWKASKHARKEGGHHRVGRRIHPSLSCTKVRGRTHPARAIRRRATFSEMRPEL